MRQSVEDRCEVAMMYLRQQLPADVEGWGLQGIAVPRNERWLEFRMSCAAEECARYPYATELESESHHLLRDGLLNLRSLNPRM